MGVLEQALELAFAGLPVFPCGARKTPAISKARGGRGFLDATTDENAVRALFKLAGDAASLVGVPTGPDAGFDVLDLDYRHGAGQWEMENAHRLPATRTHATQHDGHHLLFRHAPGVRNSASKLAPGVDIRGEGGYIIHPPSFGYVVHSNAAIAEWPGWLLQLVLKHLEQDKPKLRIRPDAPIEISEKRIKGYVDAILGKVARASLGEKHFVLRNTARLLGGIQHAAGFSDETAVAWLLQSLPQTVENWKTAEDTAYWGLKTGKEYPFDLPDRQTWTNGHARPKGPNPAPDTPDTPDMDKDTPNRILTGAQFIAGHVPPVWLIDGIVQRGRLYACTSLTGHGKTAVWLFNACMVQAGRMIGNLDTFQGNVLILAGENPADLEARMIGMAKTYKIPLNQLPYVLPGSFPMNEEQARALQADIARIGVSFAMIVGDTASSFFPGDDENSNVQAGEYARTLRTFTANCPGNPAVVVLSHPIKGATRGNLLPRGGGAFLNELDGNLAIWSETQGEVTELHWCGKIRGPDFSAIGYRLRQVPTGMLDEKHRPEMTIVAEPMSEEAVADHSRQTTANENVVLWAVKQHPDWSYAQICRHAGWIDEDQQPMKARVQRAIQTLHDDKLIRRTRKGAPWSLTSIGEAVADDLNYK